MKYLAIDADNWCWRSAHVFADLSHGEETTGVLFGFLRDLTVAQRKWSPDRVAFCFDTGRSLRERAYPNYKAARRSVPTDEAMAEEQDQRKDAVRRQILALKGRYLPGLGYHNVFAAKGYEADDLLARVALAMKRDDELVICSSDRDLYQLLTPNVSIWNGRKEITFQSFHKDWGIVPGLWADVKAIAGCKSDGIVGVRGIGEKTAAKYLRGDLKAGKKLDVILAGEEIWESNLPLVRLPYSGCPSTRLVDDELSPRAWRELCREKGLDHLIDKCPIRDRGPRGLEIQ